ncbi:MAG TPA: sialidase family protein, partial [Blastocatellia bacterium]|nr:sialidase family protein [Blastocatellia bacterium]
PKETAESAQKITLIKTPNDGLQPQTVIDAKGVIHLIYFKGEPSGGDVFYVKKEPQAEKFSAPIRVNSQPGSVIAAGTVRGAHIAIGKNSRVHVSWMGSHMAEPKGPSNAEPMLYARLNDARTAFEPQRNLMQFATGLDGGGSVAADAQGNVYVAWHGQGETKGEEHRRVYLAKSRDEGKTFTREKPAYDLPTGSCACCGMRAFAETGGKLYLVYRTATEQVNRDMYLLSSKDGGETFQGFRLHNWKINACPMSTSSFAHGPTGTFVAWETEGQVYYSSVNQSSAPIAAPDNTGKRKHPVIAVNSQGEMLFVWTEGTGWKKGGSLAWQLYGKDGKPNGEKGEVAGVPVWGLAAVVARPDGGFTVFY